MSSIEIVEVLRSSAQLFSTDIQYQVLMLQIALKAFKHNHRRGIG